MQPIIATITPGEVGAAVANLQDALLRLIERGFVRALDAPSRPTAAELQELAGGIKRERGVPMFGDATARLVMHVQVQQGLGDNLRGVVDDATAMKLNEALKALGLLDDTGAAPFVVSGEITGAGAGYRVRAYDVDFRSEELLGESAIDSARQFVVRYRAEQFKRAEKGRADLRIAVCEPGGRELVSSPVLFNAEPVARIDLAVGPGPDVSKLSEFERYLADLETVLQGATLFEVASGEPDAIERDLTFLTGETGIDRQHLTCLFKAAALAAERHPLEPAPLAAMGLRSVVTKPSGVPIEAFYGWLRQGLPADWQALCSVQITLLRGALVEAMARNIIPGRLADQIDGILNWIPNPARKGLADLLALSSLSPDGARAVAASVDGVDSVTNDVLAELVDKKAIAAPDAERLGLTVSVHRLTGAEPSIVSSVLDAEFASVKGGKLQHPRDLAALEPHEWQRVLDDARVPVPDGVSREAYARSIAMDAARAYPEHAFRQRAGRTPAALDQKLEKLRTILNTQPDALGREFHDIDLAHVPDAERKELEDVHQELRGLANMHPGLGLHEVISKSGGTPDTAKLVTERLGWISAVLEKNPDVNFLDLDYLPGSFDLATVDFGSLPEGARERVMADFKAGQRINAVTENVIPAQELQKAGFHSASAVAMTSPAELAAKSGVTIREAGVYRAKAAEQANRAAIDWFSLYEQARDHATTPVRAIPSRQQFFKPLEGFTQLINDQPWCACEPCQSVLSPAAYFVDLMHYVEENTLKGSFRTTPAHPLHLEKRRPDLWDLPLTCDNTTNFVPYLDLVNEILETYLRQVVPIDAATPVYKHLAEQSRSFSQPFTQPIERIETLLEHFGVSRHDVARAMGVPPGVQARARLKISIPEYALITTERFADPPFLRQLFQLGAGGNVTAPDLLLAPMDMAALMRATRLDHESAEAVLTTAFASVDGSATPAIAIALGKRDPADIQNNSEVVKNLTLRRLDRIHRFVRLWRTLPWSIKELDYVLGRLAGAGATGRIDPETPAGKGTLERILDLLDVNETWSLSVEELMAVTDAFQSSSLGESISLFDRLFNSPAFVSRDAKWTPLTTGRFTHPAWKRNTTAPPAAAVPGSSKPADNTLMRLLAGLQLADAEFVELVAGLGSLGAVDHTAATATADESISLSRESINTLYRHARVRSLLGRTAGDFIKILALAPLTKAAAADPAGYIRNLDDVRKVVEFSDWQKTSGFSLDEIAYLTGTRGPDASMDPARLATDVVESIRSERSLEFADTVFTQVGLTEIQSRSTVAANLSTTAGDGKSFELLADGMSYRLKAGASGAFTMPVPIAAPALADLLAKYNPLHVLDVALGNALRLSPEDVDRLRNLADPLSATDLAQVSRAVQGSAAVPDVTRLTELIAATLRFQSLFKSPVFDVDGLNFARVQADMFLGPPPAAGRRVITPAAIRNVSTYVALATATDAGYTTASGPADISAIQRVLPVVSTASNADLASTLRTDEARIAALKPHLRALPANPFDALAVMARCLVLAKTLGVSGETFDRMVTESTPGETFDRLSRAAEDVFGAFRAKYPNEKTFGEKVEPFEDRLRGRQRDGLVEYVMTRWPDTFSDPSKLYEYFLIDVMLEGCARTSRLVAAISSVQLYVHRVLMNLERSLDWDGYVPPATGVYARFTEADPPQYDTAKRLEWQWRKNYRVWEANRKVFLYPENYIEPELRDDKTPLFDELEDALLVQEITKASVHDAYSKYLTGFDELAHLKMAGAYYDQPRKQLHLFGVTQDDAPVYYYRLLDESDSTTPNLPLRFSAWQKLTLQITARKVSPLVFEGRLYLFWIETMTRPVNTFTGGTSAFSGYRHTVRVRYSTLRLDGAWSAPQVVSFVEDNGTADSRIVEDPQDLAVVKRLNKELADKNIQLTNDQNTQSMLQPVTNFIRGQADDATTARVKAQDTFRAAPIPVFEAPLEIALGIANAANANRSELDVVLALFRPIQFGLWQIALSNERGWQETLRGQEAAQANADAAVRGDEAEIRRLNDELSITKIFVRWDRSRRDHKDALDSYKPEGWEWDRVYPEAYGAGIRLTVVPRNPVPVPAPRDPDPVVDVLELTPGEFDPTPGVIHQAANPGTKLPVPAGPNWANGLVQVVPAPQSGLAAYPGQRFYAATFRLNQRLLYGSVAAAGPATSDIQCVNGEVDSLIIESQGDAVWMRKTSTAYSGKRLSTGLTPKLMQEFWRHGASTFLDAAFQETLTERPSKISPVAGQSDPKRAIPFHAENPFQTYFRESFFHVPFLVANHLNSQQEFEECQRWYHYVFDPTAAVGDPWRYFEFRHPDTLTTSLRDLLTSSQALDAYRKDPFNPHAIARTRLSAYQKSIVMKYIDNLLDWADSLFGQFTMESINEATMLYVMAQDILGPRPPMLGSCGEGKVSPKNYRTIRAGLSNVSDFLVELEAPASKKKHVPGQRVVEQLVVEPRQTNAQAMTMAITPGAPGAPGGGVAPVGVPGANMPVATPVTMRENRSSGRTYWSTEGGTPLATVHDQALSGAAGLTTIVATPGAPPIPPSRGGAIDFMNPATGFSGGHVGVRGGETLTSLGELAGKYGIGVLDVVYTLDDRDKPPLEILPRPPKTGHEPAAMVPPKDAVFCIPPNKDLLAYWSRVENRLYNIRHCMDISGVARRPELFSPELDPRMLVRMKVAGLSLDDVLNSTSGNLPPYRFTFLIEKAKQYAATVQAFGAQLLSALEKRDGEELNHLRAVHEQNLLKMRRKMMQMEITAAEDTLDGLRQQKDAVEYRRQHFAALSEGGQSSQERKQQELQRQAAGFRTAAAIAQVVSSILTVIPDVGAPTSMKFGGSQLGAAGRTAAEGLNALAAFNEMGASMAGVEASNLRRDQEWRHQIETAKRELAQIEKSIAAAGIRRDIALQSFEVHEQTIAQTEEVFDFFREKFASVDRYRLLSTELRRLYRLAFNAALTMAKMAEQAYKAERTDVDTLLGASYWDAESAGLLAGEKLLVDLQRFERQFLESNYRQIEIEQSFSLAQFAPEDLAQLRLTGDCQFSVPEWFFDLSYPGQYRRRLKAVRMTIPCVTGPYTNVGATLRLDNSEIRLTPPDRAADPLAALSPVPLRHTVSMATSKAQNDAGVFDFNFRDERYMPFEGAGAVATWQLSLPATVRMFDYGSISDVILHLSYTAEYDARLKARWDGAAQQLVALLSENDPLKDPPLTRVLSLRHDFPDVFHRLITGPADRGMDFTIEPRHFPIFLAGRTLRAGTASLRVISALDDLQGATLAIGRKAANPAAQVYREVDGTGQADISGGPMNEFDLGDVFQETPTGPGFSSALIGDYVIKLKTPGPLAPAQPGTGAADPQALYDIVLRVGYRLA